MLLQTASKPAHFMADLMADPTLSVADPTLSEVASAPAHIMPALKEGVYLIGRHFSGIPTFYLTRDGPDGIRAALLSTKTSTTQFVSPFSSKLGSFINGSFTITHTVAR